MQIDVVNAKLVRTVRLVASTTNQRNDVITQLIPSGDYVYALTAKKVNH